MKIIENLLIYNACEQISISLPNETFEFKSIINNTCKSNIWLTLNEIKKTDHIYEFQLKRIFVPEHFERAKAIYNKLYKEFIDTKIDAHLDQFLEKYEYFKEWFFLEERLINNKGKRNQKARIIFVFIKPEKCIYPLYIDTEHLTCPLKNE